MKVLTVLFLIKYLLDLFTQHGWIRKFNKKYQGQNIENLLKSENQEVVKEALKISCMSCIVAYIMLPVELLYVCWAFSYAKTIPFLFLVFWIANLIRILTKNRDNDGKLGIKYSHVKMTIVSLIDISFFSYMFYILFLK